MKTFRIGGVHPAENKLSAGKAIETLALPKQAVFPLSQHIGAPATAIDFPSYDPQLKGLRSTADKFSAVYVVNSQCYGRCQRIATPDLPNGLGDRVLSAQLDRHHLEATGDCEAQTEQHLPSPH